MTYPLKGDYIDIHNHDSKPEEGVFILDNLMAHEGILPVNMKGMTFSLGIHPWHLTESNQFELLELVRNNASDELISAIGEAGFDKLKGPSLELQRRIFEEQALLSEKFEKPLVIHCVRGWDELMASHKKVKPKMPWLIHGFRGKKELALQLISRNMYISFWFDFVVRTEATAPVRSLPLERIFLETDGSGVDIRDIYNKVSDDLQISVEELKNQILLNYFNLFRKIDLTTE
ncbi:MAG TPA: TatD family hydrolase [Bacteroidales bacterium]|nr:TatD family hydrolase [Bacteroidales bacterium]